MSRKYWSWLYSDWVLLVLAVILVVLKLPGVFTNAFPVGWDTLPHYYNFTKFLEFLSEGRFNGYDVNQSGGTSLFYFYAPLGYLLGTLFKFLGFGAISEAVAFKLTLLAITCLYIFAFWFFTKTFVKNNIAAKLAIVFSLFFLFYPRIWAGHNLGVSSVFEVGLFTSFLSLSTILFFFSFLNRFRVNGKKGDFILAILFGAATILSSLLSTFFLLFAWAVYALIFIKDKKFFLKQVAMGLYMILIAAFFLFPLLKFSPWHSADIGKDITQSAFLFLIAPFLNIFAYFNPENGLDQTMNQLVLSGLFYLISLIIAIFAFIGVVHPSENREDKVIKYFSLVFFIFLFFGTSFTLLFRFLAIHYYRLTPLFLTMFLLLSLRGVSLLWEDRVRVKLNQPAKRIVLVLIVFLILSWSVFFSFTARFPFSSPLITASGMKAVNTPYHFNLENYLHADILQEIVKYFKKLNPQRILVEDDTKEIVRTGPPHTLFALLNMNDQPTLNGLFVESSVQSPLVMAVSRQMFDTLTWGYMPPIFLSETIEPVYYDRRQHENPESYHREMFERLRLFGIDYIVLNSDKALNKVRDAGDILTEVASFRGDAPGQVEGIPLAVNFRIFRYNNPLPLMRRSENPVGLYLDTSVKNISNFRNMAADGFYASDVFDMPIAFTPRPELLSDEELSRFHYFIVAKSVENDNDFMARLKAFGKPILFYNWANFGVVVNGDSSLPPFLKQMKDRPLAGTMPWIINLGYFPNWRSESGPVFAVTPGQMLVFSEEPETIQLKFVPSPVEKASRWVSIIALLLLPFLPLQRFSPNRALLPRPNKRLL